MGSWQDFGHGLNEEEERLEIGRKGGEARNSRQEVTGEERSGKAVEGRERKRKTREN